jgi:nicotinamide-nucleotide amidase
MSLAETLDVPIEGLVQEVLGEACDQKLKLATAESCTGGLLASVLTDVAGLSHAFDRGFVTYSKEAKAELLGVAPDLIDRHGVVSDPVVRAMAEGAIEHSRADVAVAITGFADNSSQEGPGGLVFIAAARRGRATKVVRKEFGDIGRERVREQAVAVGLELFRSQIV